MQNWKLFVPPPRKLVWHVSVLSSQVVKLNGSFRFSRTGIHLGSPLKAVYFDRSNSLLELKRANCCSPDWREPYANARWFRLGVLKLNKQQRSIGQIKISEILNRDFCGVESAPVLCLCYLQRSLS